MLCGVVWYSIEVVVLFVGLFHFMFNYSILTSIIHPFTYSLSKFDSIDWGTFIALIRSFFFLSFFFRNI